MASKKMALRSVRRFQKCEVWTSTGTVQHMLIHAGEFQECGDIVVDNCEYVWICLVFAFNSYSNIWGVLEIWDPQVTISFNAKSWSSMTTGWFGIPISGNLHGRLLTLGTWHEAAEWCIKPTIKTCLWCLMNLVGLMANAFRNFACQKFPSPPQNQTHANSSLNSALLYHI